MADIDLLRSFMTIYRAGSITGAASALGLTQPAISQHLKSLEAQLGRQLFRRAARGMEPLPAAHALAQEAGPHLDSLMLIVEGTRMSARSLSGTVTLGVEAALLGPNVFSSLCLCGVWKSSIHLKVQTGGPASLLEALKAGGADLLLVSGKGPFPELRHECIRHDSDVLVAGPQWSCHAQHIAAQGWEALRGLPTIACQDAPTALDDYLARTMEASGRIKPCLVVDEARTALAAVAGGIGAAVLPRILCHEGLKRGELVLLHHPRQPAAREIHLVRNLMARPSPRLALVWDLIRKAAPGW